MALAKTLHTVIVELILIGIVVALFFLAINRTYYNDDIKQQVLQKQLAVLIDSADPGFSFKINKVQKGGYIQKIYVKESRIFVKINGLDSIKGYPYFTKNKINIQDKDTYFLISIK